MSTTARDPWGRILVLVVMVLTASARTMFAANCDQPRVSFQDGQLSISSAGCSLRQVLTTVARQTGIETEIPPSTSAIPVFFDLGPGNPRQVVRALLEGVPFNWSLAIRENASPNLERIVLTEQIAHWEVAQPATASLTATRATDTGKLLAGHAAASGRAGQGDPGATTTNASLERPQSDQPW